jgi:hypothetical protein
VVEGLRSDFLGLQVALRQAITIRIDRTPTWSKQLEIALEVERGAGSDNVMLGDLSSTAKEALFNMVTTKELNFSADGNGDYSVKVRVDCDDIRTRLAAAATSRNQHKNPLERNAKLRSKIQKQRGAWGCARPRRGVLEGTKVWNRAHVPGISAKRGGDAVWRSDVRRASKDGGNMVLERVRADIRTRVRKQFTCFCKQLAESKRDIKTMSCQQLLSFIDRIYSLTFQQYTAALARTCKPKPEHAESVVSALTPISSFLSDPTQSAPGTLTRSVTPKNVGSFALATLDGTSQQNHSRGGDVSATSSLASDLARFPHVVYQIMKTRHGLHSVASPVAWSMAASVAQSRDESAVDLFARFLDESYDSSALLLFLYARDVAQRLMQDELVPDPVRRGSTFVFGVYATEASWKQVARNVLSGEDDSSDIVMAKFEEHLKEFASNTTRFEEVRTTAKRTGLSGKDLRAEQERMKGRTEDTELVPLMSWDQFAFALVESFAEVTAPEETPPISPLTPAQTLPSPKSQHTSLRTLGTAVMSLRHATLTSSKSKLDVVIDQATKDEATRVANNLVASMKTRGQNLGVEDAWPFALATVRRNALDANSDSPKAVSPRPVEQNAVEQKAVEQKAVDRASYTISVDEVGGAWKFLGCSARETSPVRRDPSASPAKLPHPDEFAGDVAGGVHKLLVTSTKELVYRAVDVQTGRLPRQLSADDLRHIKEVLVEKFCPLADALLDALVHSDLDEWLRITATLPDCDADDLQEYYNTLLPQLQWMLRTEGEVTPDTAARLCKGICRMRGLRSAAEQEAARLLAASLPPGAFAEREVPTSRGSTLEPGGRASRAGKIRFDPAKQDASPTRQDGSMRGSWVVNRRGDTTPDTQKRQSLEAPRGNTKSRGDRGRELSANSVFNTDGDETTPEADMDLSYSMSEIGGSPSNSKLSEANNFGVEEAS